LAAGLKCQLDLPPASQGPDFFKILSFKYVQRANLGTGHWALATTAIAKKISAKWSRREVEEQYHRRARQGVENKTKPTHSSASDPTVASVVPSAKCCIKWSRSQSRSRSRSRSWT
jgi:hypothetical protein